MPTDGMNVLFVCPGNICRSPIAVLTLQHRSDEEGLGLAASRGGTRALHNKRSKWQGQQCV